MKQTKITKSARDMDCQIRLPFICNFDSTTTVFAHVGIDSGMGAKASDLEGTYSCSSCHDEIDGRTLKMADRQEVKLFAYEGAMRTREILSYMELIKT
jgi:hypothetical protein